MCSCLLSSSNKHRTCNFQITIRWSTWNKRTLKTKKCYGSTSICCEITLLPHRSDTWTCSSWRLKQFLQGKCRVRICTRWLTKAYLIILWNSRATLMRWVQTTISISSNGTTAGYMKEKRQFSTKCLTTMGSCRLSTTCNLIFSFTRRARYTLLSRWTKMIIP